jgi:hypothetical protein
VSEPLTPLEREMFRLTAERHWPWFRMDGLSVTKRENTGVGRYAYLEDAHHQTLSDGDYSADYPLVEMEGIPDGMGWVVNISDGKLCYIELFTFSDPWDGAERPWKITYGLTPRVVVRPGAGTA